MYADALASCIAKSLESMILVDFQRDKSLSRMMYMYVLYCDVLILYHVNFCAKMQAHDYVKKNPEKSAGHGLNMIS